MPTPLITRLTHRLFGSPLLRNSIRGELVEEMVAQALEPEWALCADDWGACDLRQVANLKAVKRPLRIQVKQSAARQSWHADDSPPPPSPQPSPRFSIAHKTGHWEGQTWIAEPSRNADLFIFGWHPLTDASADHRNPDQWLFYVVPEAALPPQKTISLATLARIADPVRYRDLSNHVRQVAAGCSART